jgi:hypothetical protein
LWCKEFEKNLESDLKNEIVKFVINNSTDPSVNERYQQLFKTYGFTELRYNNIGICGGRQVAAEHFNDNNFKYMIFFEDDMLLCGKDDESKRCKNGYAKYFPNVLSKSIAIMESENLDYLKLCFSEFYGDNNVNWSWYNSDKNKHDIWFASNENASDIKRVRVYYTNSFRGVPYGVGEYHYCNWPILFNKDGNRKIFLETKFEHKYEQVWMSFVMELIFNKKIRAGCLMGSIITHNRKYHYDKKIRRENEHYTN